MGVSGWYFSAVASGDVDAAGPAGQRAALRPPVPIPGLDRHDGRTPGNLQLSRGPRRTRRSGWAAGLRDRDWPWCWAVNCTAGSGYARRRGCDRGLRGQPHANGTPPVLLPTTCQNRVKAAAFRARQAHRRLTQRRPGAAGSNPRAVGVPDPFPPVTLAPPAHISTLNVRHNRTKIYPPGRTAGRDYVGGKGRCDWEFHSPRPPARAGGGGGDGAHRGQGQGRSRRSAWTRRPPNPSRARAPDHGGDGPGGGEGDRAEGEPRRRPGRRSPGLSTPGGQLLLFGRRRRTCRPGPTRPPRPGAPAADRRHRGAQREQRARGAP